MTAVRRLAWILCVAGLTLAVLGVEAQGISTEIAGRVIADDGTPIPGVLVELSGAAIVPRSIYTSADGSFRFLQIPPGSYQLRATLEGMQEEVRYVNVALGASLDMQLTMSTDLVEDTIVVTAGPIEGDVDAVLAPVWNTWIEVQDGRDGEPVERLEVGGRYHFYLDISRYRYQELWHLRGLRSEAVRWSFAQELERIYRAGRVQMTAHLRPMLLGRALRWVDGDPQPETWKRGEWRSEPGDEMVPLEIRLGNLFAGEGPPPGIGESFRTFSERTRAGAVRWVLEAVEEDCAVMALAVWSEDRRLPVDQIVHSVAVGDAECPDVAETGGLRPGFLSALYDSAGTRPDAALQLFEVPVGSTGGRTVAVYVPREPVGDCGHFAWDRPTLLSRYFFQQRTFADGLQSAWKDEIRDRYQDLGLRLSRLLFPHQDEQSCGGAAALEAMQKLSETAGRSLFVRMVSVDNESLYLPLGLLFTVQQGSPGTDAGATGSDAAGPYFHHRLRLRQPLPLETYREPRTCVGDWSFILPRRLKGYQIVGEVDIALPPELDEATETLRDIDDLRDLMRAWDYDEWDPAAGVVILAHHADGELSFDDPLDSWLWAEVEGRFPEGSVALLSVCSAGDLARSRELVDALNEANFDAVILSPFAIHTPFGVELAINFAQLVKAAQSAAQSAPQRATQTVLVVDLFDQALELTVQQLEPELGARARGMASELVYAGNPLLRLCPAPEEGR